MQIKGDAAFERLVQELRKKFPGKALSLNDIAGEAARKGLELLVTLDVQVKAVERLSDKDCSPDALKSPTCDT